MRPRGVKGALPGVSIGGSWKRLGEAGGAGFWKDGGDGRRSVILPISSKSSTGKDRRDVPDMLVVGVELFSWTGQTGFCGGESLYVLCYRNELEALPKWKQWRSES